MKIAITSTGPTLDDSVETRFGRCAYFLIIDPDTMACEPISNPNVAVGGGAGILSAQLLAHKGVKVVLTGNCGPNAFQTFGAAGIQVITGVSGRVAEAVRQYQAGALAAASNPSVQSHFGMGMGGGRGMGRGMGMGGGKGMGRGMGMGQGNQSVSPTNQPISSSPEPTGKKEGIAALQKQAEELKKQMDQVLARIKELEEEEA